MKANKSKEWEDRHNVLKMHRYALKTISAIFEVTDMLKNLQEDELQSDFMSILNSALESAENLSETINPYAMSSDDIRKARDVVDKVNDLINALYFFYKEDSDHDLKDKGDTVEDIDFSEDIKAYQES